MIENWKMEDLQCRELSEKELDRVAEIEKANFSQPWSRESFEQAIRSKDMVYLTVMLQDTVVGYGGYIRSFEEACITNIAVDLSWRRMGIGSYLLENLMQYGYNRGIERFTLEVRVSNTAAIRLYEKHGFVSAGIRRNFYSFPREDANIMWTGEIDT